MIELYDDPCLHELVLWLQRLRIVLGYGVPVHSRVDLGSSLCSGCSHSLCGFRRKTEKEMLDPAITSRIEA